MNRRTQLEHLLVISRAAAQKVAEGFRKPPGTVAGTITIKAAGAEIASTQDQDADDVMNVLAARLLPDYRPVTEENKKDHGNVAASKIFVGDGWDGTTIGLADSKRPVGAPCLGWGNTACIVEAGITQVGVINQPGIGQLFYAIRGEGCFHVCGAEYEAFMNDGVIPTGKRFRIDVFVPGGMETDEKGPYMVCAPQSGKMLNNWLFRRIYLRLRELLRKYKLFANEVAYGCAVANAVQLLMTGMQFYCNVAGGTIWDLAAASLCIVEAGGIATDLHGKPLTWTKIETTVFWAINQKVANRMQKIFDELLESRWKSWLRSAGEWWQWLRAKAKRKPRK